MGGARFPCRPDAASPSLRGRMWSPPTKRRSPSIRIRSTPAPFAAAANFSSRPRSAAARRCSRRSPGWKARSSRSTAWSTAPAIFCSAASPRAGASTRRSRRRRSWALPRPIPPPIVDGHDAAEKLSILVREAFGVALHPERIAKQSLRDPSPAPRAGARSRRGAEAGRRAAAARRRQGRGRGADRVLARRPSARPERTTRKTASSSPTAAGRVHRSARQGAGRWPTATSVFADVMDVQRALLGRAAARARAGVVKLTA